MSDTIITAPAKPKVKKRKKRTPAKPKVGLVKKTAVATGTWLWDQVKGFLTVPVVIAFAAGAYFL